MEKSKTQIKNIIFLVLNLTLLLYIPTATFAHETDVVHEESVPTISPLLLIWIVLGIAIAGLLLWKFVLHSHKSSSPTQSSSSEKTPPAQEKTVSQSGEKKSP